MRINRVELIHDHDEVRIQSLIEYADQKQYLWYQVDQRYEEYLTTEKLDGFLVGLLLLAMKYGEDIYIDGAISEKLYYNVSNYYMKILTLVMPSLRGVAVNPQRLDNGTSYRSQGAIVTGFSAGIDSFCTVVDHFFAEPPPSYKLTHFIFNNVGSHGKGEAERTRQLFNQRYELIKGFPKEIGIELVKVDSNLSDLLRMDFVQTHPPRNVSAVLILQKLFGKYYYSSAFKYEDCSIGPTRHISCTESGTMHLLSTETLECISTGSQYSRVEKTEKVAGIEPSYRYLNVCTATDTAGQNCSLCDKCCRTLLTLEMLGDMERYKNIFDLTRYKRIRNFYISNVLSQRYDPFHHEIVEYARQVRYNFPLKCIAVSWMLRFLPERVIQIFMSIVRAYYQHAYKTTT